MVERLAKRTVKPEVLSDNMVQDVDLKNVGNLVEGSKVNVEVETSELIKKSKAMPKDLLSFRIKCRECIVTIISKLLTKSPLQYSLCKYMKFLDPHYFLSNEKGALNYLKRALIATDYCQLEDVDDILEEFEDFCKAAKVNERFINFDRYKDRLDEVYFSQLSNSGTQKLWKFVKKCLVLSHGQASVERGFSENKEVLETNMGSETLVARRLIKDHVRAIGGVEKFSISSKLRKSCSLSYKKYAAKMEEVKAKDGNNMKRKMVVEEVVTLKKRKLELEDSVAYLKKESDKNADMAESATSTNEQLALFTSAHALRKTMVKKDEELVLLREEIQEKESLLKTF